MCGPGYANYFRLRWPADYLWACGIPAGFTWDQVSNSHNMCSPNSYQYIFRLRIPMIGLWACHVPPGWTYDAIQNSCNTCSPNNYQYIVRLSR